MKKTLIVFGGDSLEHDISIVSALTIYQKIKEKSRYLLVYLSYDGVFYYGKALLTKSNYETKYRFKKGYFKRTKNKTYFLSSTLKIDVDNVILCVHGKGMEDGTLGAFFDILKVPVTYGGIINASLIQDKYSSKIFLKKLGVPITKGLKISQKTIEKHHFNISGLLKDYNYPLIIKPISLGSSIGVYKVYNEQELHKHLMTLFHLDNEVVIEECVENLREYNIALVGDDRGVEISSIEEVNHENKVLSFKDKYEEFSAENAKQIPALIHEELESQIIKFALKAFEGLKCSGVVRMDFFYDELNKQLYLNEINSIPGSLAYYLFENKGICVDELLELITDCANYRYSSKKQFVTRYQESNLLKITSKK